jgi:hypothetical protein
VWTRFVSEYGGVVGSGERGNGPSESIEGGDFFDCYLLKGDSVSKS